jgi:hypothetical protein
MRKTLHKIVTLSLALAMCLSKVIEKRSNSHCQPILIDSIV